MDTCEVVMNINSNYSETHLKERGLANWAWFLISFVVSWRGVSVVDQLVFCGRITRFFESVYWKSFGFDNYGNLTPEFDGEFQW